jgi:hypothetical protein
MSSADTPERGLELSCFRRNCTFPRFVLESFSARLNLAAGLSRYLGWRTRPKATK